MKHLLILFLFFPLVVLASGSDDDISQTTDVTTDVATDVTTSVVNEIAGSDVSITGSTSRALGLGRSSFDVDINQCMGSTAWDTPLGGRQRLVINWVCLAEFYLKTGQPDLAAVAICNTEMLKEFDDEAACEAAHDFFIEISESLVVEEAVTIQEDSHWEEEEDWHQEQMQMQQDYDERIERLERRANRPAPIVIDKGAERRAKSRESLAEFQKGEPDK